MRGALECMRASGTLVPNVLTIAGPYFTTTFNREGARARTDDNVLFAKLNDFYLGGVYISLFI